VVCFLGARFGCVVRHVADPLLTCGAALRRACGRRASRWTTLYDVCEQEFFRFFGNLARVIGARRSGAGRGPRGRLSGLTFANAGRLGCGCGPVSGGAATRSVMGEFCAIVAAGTAMAEGGGAQMRGDCAG